MHHCGRVPYRFEESVLGDRILKISGNVLSRLLLLKPGHPALLLERGAARRYLLDFEGARADAELARDTSELSYVEGATALLRLLDRDAATVH